MNNNKIAVIGAGNVGSAIAHNLFDNNLLEWILARSDDSYNNLLKFVPKDKIIRSVSDIPFFPDYTILTVSDSSIYSVSNEISEQFSDLKDKCFSHCSGTLGKNELKALEKNGAIIAAVHPYQTFFQSSKGTLNNIPWGIDCDNTNENYFIKLVSLLNGKHVILSDKAKNNKELYHISAIAASNYLNTLISLSSDLLKEIDMNPELFLKTIIETTLNNNYELLNSSNISPLTGPIVRGDSEILEKHLNALAKHPVLLTQYKLIGLATLESAYNKKLLNEKQYNKIKTILEKP